MEKHKPQTVDEAIKAFGGCLKCWGKGYGTSISFASAYPDFPGDTYSKDQNPPMIFCDCERGRQLKKMVRTI